MHNTLKAFYILNLFCPLLLIAQQRTVISGRVVYGHYKTSPLLVVNVNAEKETYTDSLGNFTVPAHTGDLFAISGPNIRPKKIRYTADLIKNNVFTIPVQAEAAQLDEVVINRSNISAESLGIVPKGQKTYTPAERQLKTASSPDITVIAGSMPGIAISTDFIINAITGRTKALKRALDKEKKQLTIKYIRVIYSDNELNSQYRIPMDNIDGFLYYIAEDGECIALAKAKNKAGIEKRLYVMAVQYLEIIQNEN